MAIKLSNCDCLLLAKGGGEGGEKKKRKAKGVARWLVASAQARQKGTNRSTHPNISRPRGARLRGTLAHVPLWISGEASPLCSAPGIVSIFRVCDQCITRTLCNVRAPKGPGRTFFGRNFPARVPAGVRAREFSSDSELTKLPQVTHDQLLVWS